MGSRRTDPSRASPATRYQQAIRLSENGTGSAKFRSTAFEKRIAAVYPYTDADRRLLYENVRYLPKGFRQRRPDGNGGYIYNLAGVERVPYRLPELLTSRQAGIDEIWFTEGEKDADNLRLLGFTATSFKNWTSDFNQYVKGAHAVLFRDHDQSGRRQASEAAKIIAGVAASLKVIDFYEGEPEKGQDVSDWIAAQKAEGLSDEEIAERLSIIVEDAEAWTDTQGQTAPSFNLFKTKTATEWLMDAKERPIPKELFDEFWFEGELSILFADTGKGKSILAVQIGESIASGRAIYGFSLTAEAQKVLYLDFELSDKMFEARYSEKPASGDYHVNHHHFADDFIRAEIDPEAMLPEGFTAFEDYLYASLEDLFIKTKAKILIVDNLTYLRSETERAKEALPLMKTLKRLKSKFGLSILALAHTPKRDLSKPLTVNDLQGSKMLSNFADSIFAIGESHKDKNLRYLKQIKTRNADMKYDAENVRVCEVAKPSNFLQFQYLEFGRESDHLKEILEKDKDSLIQKAHELQAQGRTQRDIARELGISASTVNRLLQKRVSLVSGVSA